MLEERVIPGDPKFVGNRNVNIYQVSWLGEVVFSYVGEDEDYKDTFDKGHAAFANRLKSILQVNEW